MTLASQSPAAWLLLTPPVEFGIGGDPWVMIADTTGAYCLNVDGIPVDGVDRQRAREIAENAGVQPTLPHDWLALQLSNIGMWDIGAPNDADSLAQAQQHALAAARVWEPPSRERQPAASGAPAAAMHDAATPIDVGSSASGYRDFDELDDMCNACGAPAGVPCAPGCGSS